MSITPQFLIGKTTIARRVPRFWDVNSGRVSFGGIDVKTVDSKELMDSVSFVSQNTKLFKITLLENIKYGNLNVTTEEIERTIDLAQCKEIIDKHPLGLETKIGTEGTHLSGGGCQSLSIARVLLKDAPIVLLDEATVSLDVENETKIQAGISKLVKNKTVLIIAHSMRTVTNAHKIIVLDNGMVAETGTPND